MVSLSAQDVLEHASKILRHRRRCLKPVPFLPLRTASAGSAGDLSSKGKPQGFVSPKTVVGEFVH